MNKILSDIKKMKLVADGEGYKVYEDDASGDRYEVDYDGDVVVHVYKINKNGEVVSVIV